MLSGVQKTCNKILRVTAQNSVVILDAQKRLRKAMLLTWRDDEMLEPTDTWDDLLELDKLAKDDGTTRTRLVNPHNFFIGPSALPEMTHDFTPFPMSICVSMPCFLGKPL